MGVVGPAGTVERVTRNDAQFRPFILEYAQRQREAAANMKRMLVEEEVDDGPAAKHLYSCPSETVIIYVVQFCLHLCCTCAFVSIGDKSQHI
jgi:hypothetical protein